MAKIKISRKAAADIDGIWEYTLETWSEDQAEKYFYDIKESVAALPELPDYLCRHYDLVKPGLLGFHVGHHIIFYKKQQDGSVLVDRILHEMMDFPRHL